MKYAKAFIAATMVAVSCSQLEAVNYQLEMIQFKKKHEKHPSFQSIIQVISQSAQQVSPDDPTLALVPELKIKYLSLKTNFKTQQQAITKPFLTKNAVALLTRYLAIVAEIAGKNQEDYDSTESKCNKYISSKYQKANL